MQNQFEYSYILYKQNTIDFREDTILEMYKISYLAHLVFQDSHQSNSKQAPGVVDFEIGENVVFNVISM